MILSKEHGVAPALTFCRICGKDTQELLLLGVRANKVMRDLYESTDGKYGSKDGYKKYGHNKCPSNEPCDECKTYLEGGIIFMAEDTEEYLRLDKDQTDSLVGRILNAQGLVMDIEAMRGKVQRLKKAFWYTDGENLRLRDPKEWS